LLAGIAFLFFAYTKNKRKTIKIYTILTVLGFISAIPLSPWITKNFIETESVSIDSLINGKLPGPNMNARDIIDTYEFGKNGK